MRFTRGRKDRIPAPRGPGTTNVGVLVLNFNLTATRLPFEGPLAVEIDRRIDDVDYSGDLSCRLAAVAEWLTAEHGATLVLPVWGEEVQPDQSTRRLLLHATTDTRHIEPPDSDLGLAGIIYDTPTTRSLVTNPQQQDAGHIARLLQKEVAEYNRWLNQDLDHWHLDEDGRPTLDGPLS